jgi:hypothetical protein
MARTMRAMTIGAVEEWRWQGRSFMTRKRRRCFLICSIEFRPRQGKVDNRLLPGKTVKVSGKG